MKKIITLVLALAVIIGLSFYVYNLNKNAGTSDEQLSLIEFAIEDVTTVDKVIISDAFGRTFEIIKNGDEWTDKDGNKRYNTSIMLPRVTGVLRMLDSKPKSDTSVASTPSKSDDDGADIPF